MLASRRLFTPTATVLLLAQASVAYSAWLSVGAGESAILATRVLPGEQPEAHAGGDDVAVTWPAGELADGTEVDGYEIRRHQAGAEDAGEMPGGDCQTVVTTTECTDTNVPVGEWEYTVTPRKSHRWIGATSPPSDPVTISDSDGMHVANLDGYMRGSNPWSAIAVVTIHDNAGAPLEGVEVAGVWETSQPPASTHDTCTTGTDGTCEVGAFDMRTGGGNTATFTVETLVSERHHHDPSQDVYSQVTITRNGSVTAQ